MTALFSTATVTESDPLHDVHDHPAEADLQGAEVRVDGEDLHDLEVAGDHPRPEQPLRDQVGVVRVPLLPAEVTFGPTYIIYPSEYVRLPLCVRVQSSSQLDGDHITGGEPDNHTMKLNVKLSPVRTFEYLSMIQEMKQVLVNQSARFQRSERYSARP